MTSMFQSVFTYLKLHFGKKYIHLINPKFEILHKDKLHELILEHASVLLYNGKKYGPAIDGAILLSQHTYTYILIEPTGLKHAGLQNVEVQSVILDKGKTSINFH